MGATSIYALPYPEATDPADVPVDMKELVDRLEIVLPMAGPSIVTSLPGSPTDGQRVLLRASTNGPLWQLRYSAAMFALDGYGWEFVGGSALGHEVDASDTINSATYVNATNVGPLVTVPVAGIYLAEYGMAASPSSVARANIMGAPVWANGIPANDDGAVMVQTPAADIAYNTVFRKRTFTTATGPAELRLKYRQGTAAAGGIVFRRSLYLTPVRVK